MAKQYKKKDGGKNLFVIVTVVIALAVMVGAYLFLSSNSATTADGFKNGPKNMPNDTITIGQDFKAETAEGVKAGTTFEPAKYEAREDGKTTVRIFIDPQCPVCGIFEETNKDLIDQYLNEGKIVVDYSVLSFLDEASTTAYSSRATNALACVADQSPDNFYGFLANLYSNQPEEGTSGLTNKVIYSLAQDAGVPATDDMATCITSKQYSAWVEESTNRALEGPIVDVNSGTVTGTPTVFLNGEKIEIAPDDAAGFKAALDSAIAGQPTATTEDAIVG